MAFCSHCGAEIPEDSRFCPKCGASVEKQNEIKNAEDTRDTTAQTPERTDDHNLETSPPSASGEGHGAAIGSMVCGIIGVVLCFFGYSSIISIILGIIGLVMAGNSKKAGNREGVRTAGFVLSILAIVGGSIVFIYLTFLLAFVGATVQSAAKLFG